MLGGGWTEAPCLSGLSVSPGSRCLLLVGQAQGHHFGSRAGCRKREVEATIWSVEWLSTEGEQRQSDTALLCWGFQPMCGGCESCLISLLPWTGFEALKMLPGLLGFSGGPRHQTVFKWEQWSFIIGKTRPAGDAEQQQRTFLSIQLALFFLTPNKAYNKTSQEWKKSFLEIT